MGRAKKEEQMAAMLGKGAPMGQPPQPSVKDMAQATLKDLLKPPAAGQPGQGPQ